MTAEWRISGSVFKTLFVAAMLFAVGALSACSTNPATGEQQFAAFMSPQQEQQAGASEHENVMKTFGLPENSDALQAYVNNIGQKLAANTERTDVQYKFFVLDDEMVNAFALPGGYIYVTRGLMAYAGNEAQLAAVLAHEIGHVTGRHSAERYSRGIVTSLGAMVLSAALDSQAASQALGIGSDLFMKSYSRGQENEADDLGIRYLARAGYDTTAMAGFLSNLQNHTALQAHMNGSKEQQIDWFSTHPLTADRMQSTIEISRQYPQGGTVNRDQYLGVIDGMVYGESARHGFARGNRFYHPQIGFTFEVPSGFTMKNQPNQIIASNKSGTVIIFDAAGNPQGIDPLTYMKQVWMQGEKLADAENITINGMQAATGSFSGVVDGKQSLIRLVAVKWNANTIFRFQMAMPVNASATLVEDLKRTTYSLRALSAAEKRDVRPYRIKIVTAAAGDTAASLGRRMPFTTYQEERFRTLNGLPPGQALTAGQRYKLIVE